MNVSMSKNNTNLVLGPEFVYVPFVISCFGLLGNFMTFMTIICTELRKNFVNTYILVLLVSDSVLLLTLFLRKFVAIDTFSFGACAVMKYLWNTPIYVSNLAIVSLTLERFFAICYPFQHLRRSRDLNRWKVIVCWLVPILIFGFNELYALRKPSSVSIHFGPASNSDLKCVYDTDKKFVKLFFHFPRLFFQFLLTFLVVTIVNTAIFVKLRVRHVIIGDTGFTEMRSTNVLLAIIPMVYILLNLPFAIKNVARFFQTNKSNESFFSDHYVLSTGAFYLFCLNFAMNFVLYSLLSQKFRCTFCQLWFYQKQFGSNSNANSARWKSSITKLMSSVRNSIKNNTKVSVNTERTK